MSYIMYFLILMADGYFAYIITASAEISIIAMIVIICATCLMQIISFLSLRPTSLKKLRLADRNALEAATAELKYCAEETNFRLPKKLHVYMNKSSDMNAFAVGRNKVILTSGLLEHLRYDSRTLAAVIAHEVGHLKRFHCYATAIVNLNILVIALFFSLVNFGFVTVITALLFFILSIVMNDCIALCISGLIGKILKALLSFASNIIILLHMAVAAIFFRRMEYNADRTAACLSLGVELIGFLYMLENIKSNEKRSFVETIQSSHPPTYSRIKRLEEYEAEAYPLLS